MARVWWLGLVSIFVAGCAHRTAKNETPPTVRQVSAPTPAPQLKTRIKYVYVETPVTTVSATTTAPFERTETPPKSFLSEVTHLFWPLITMILTGFALIAILYGEHRVLDRQFERRALKRVGATPNLEPKG